MPLAIQDYVFDSGFEHDLIGNSWKVTDEGNWFLPERTLGWEFIEFASRWYLDQKGDPFQLTDEQMRVVLWAYSLDERGMRESSEVVLQRLKGWG